MGITRFKRIQNLDITLSQFKTIEAFQTDLKISRAKLLRTLIEVAFEYPERIREKTRANSLFER